MPRFTISIEGEPYPPLDSADVVTLCDYLHAYLRREILDAPETNALIGDLRALPADAESGDVLFPGPSHWNTKHGEILRRAIFLARTELGQKALPPALLEFERELTERLPPDVVPNFVPD